MNFLLFCSFVGIIGVFYYLLKSRDTIKRDIKGLKQDMKKYQERIGINADDIVFNAKRNREDINKIDEKYGKITVKHHERIMNGNRQDAFNIQQYKEVTAEQILAMEVPKKEKEYDFKPFDKVLVRDKNCDVWNTEFFSYKEDSYYSFVTLGRSYWRQCIPYEGNEHLLGTSDDPNF